jgi:hypothetical protein
LIDTTHKDHNLHTDQLPVLVEENMEQSVEAEESEKKKPIEAPKEIQAVVPEEKTKPSGNIISVYL